MKIKSLFDYLPEAPKDNNPAKQDPRDGHHVIRAGKDVFIPRKSRCTS